MRVISHHIDQLTWIKDRFSAAEIAELKSNYNAMPKVLPQFPDRANIHRVDGISNLPESYTGIPLVAGTRKAFVIGICPSERHPLLVMLEERPATETWHRAQHYARTGDLTSVSPRRWVRSSTSTVWRWAGLEGNYSVRRELVPCPPLLWPPASQ